MVGTVEVANRLEVVSNGVFLALVLVGDDRDFTRVNTGMQFQCILPELSLDLRRNQCQPMWAWE